MIKKLICLTLVLLLSIGLCACGNNGLKIYASDGSLIATISDYTTGDYITQDENLNAYIDIVYQEAVEVLSLQENLTVADAKKKLVSKGYSLHTNFDPSVYNAVKTAYLNQGNENLDFGCAVTNNNGKLLAVYSGGAKGENFATKPTPPYSALKPLSAYAPAIDSKIALWSTLYLDSPVKKITLSDNSMVDWPTNANGTYQNQSVTLETALKKSLNTTAVRCLMDYGVTRSINFLKDSFNFPISAEEQIVAQYGEEEVLGNLGMGFLRDGVSPVNMAGYYQIFVRGGVYVEPKTISKITNSSNKTIYQPDYNKKTVIENSTSVIMNKLLQGVVSPDGTGKDAACGEIEIGGKTGTGELGNWFVGFSPEYSCAVWHGTQSPQNISTKIFADVINGIPNKMLSKFTVTPDVKLSAYCCKSGLLKSENCDDFKMGFFAVDSLEQICDLH